MEVSKKNWRTTIMKENRMMEDRREWRKETCPVSVVSTPVLLFIKPWLHKRYFLNCYDSSDCYI